MNKVDKALEELIQNLNNEPVIIEFVKARDLVSSDVFVIETEKKLKELQQLITRNAMDKKLYETYKAEYDLRKEQFDEHPYVLNYNSLLNEVNELLLNIKSIIE